jgi:uncharacterized membrane protein YjfL (UPF0719 family)
VEGIGMFSQLHLSVEYLSSLGIHLAIAVVMIGSVKYLSAFISNVNAKHELAEKDNHAFGISIAGVALAVTIMMTGVVGNSIGGNYGYDLVIGYGVLGIILMSFTRFFFDRVSFPTLSVKREILEGNIAAAILDAGNVVATAVIIRAMMMWVESETVYGLLIVLVGYFISQFILSIASLYRITLYNLHHDGTLCEGIEDGNVALAWRFTGYRLGVALAITATAGMVPYATDNLNIIFVWLVMSFVFMVAVSICEAVVDYILLWGIDVDDEVNNQKNIAIGVIQCVVTIAIGLMIASLTN